MLQACDDDHDDDVQLKNYYTTFFGMAQALAAWLLYVIATDSYRSVARLSSDRAADIKKKLKRIPRDIVCIVLLIAAFYSAYLPPLRVLLFGVDKYAFFPCNVPFENHWDFRIHEVRGSLCRLLFLSSRCYGNNICSHINMHEREFFYTFAIK